MKVIKRHALQERLVSVRKKVSIFLMVQPLTRSNIIGFLLASVSLIAFNILTGNHIVCLSRDVLLPNHGLLDRLSSQSPSSSPSSLPQFRGMNWSQHTCLSHWQHWSYEACLFVPSNTRSNYKVMKLFSNIWRFTCPSEMFVFSE